MERRSSKRISLGLEAEITSDNIRYAAFIRNISEYGLNAIITPFHSSFDIPSGKEKNLKCELPSGKQLCLTCKKIWSQAVSTGGSSKKIGAAIINPPIHYSELLASL
jgi:hypothetical protein